MTKFLLAALLSAFIFSTVAHAKENKIEPIRIVPKQNRHVASEDDGFIPLLTPKKPKAVKPAEKRKPAAASKKPKA